MHLSIHLHILSQIQLTVSTQKVTDISVCSQCVSAGRRNQDLSV